MKRMFSLQYVFTVVFVLNLPLVSVCLEEVEAPEEVLDCLERAYTYTINKPYIDPDTEEELPCYDEVTVYACYGRCQSYEYGDMNMPYKISEHSVCTYKNRIPRTVTLTHCHPEHPDPTAQVFDATCECRKCSIEDTSCENV